MKSYIEKIVLTIMSKSFIKNLKRTGAVLLTISIIFVGYKCAYKIFSDKVGYRHYAPFLKNRTNYDIFFMGSSHMHNGIFPMQLWNDYGITSYNLGTGDAYIHTNYGILKLALKHKKPKIVVLDTLYAFNEYNITHNGFAHQAFDAFPFSMSKIFVLNEIFNNSVNKVNIHELIVPFSLYHSRWSDSKIKISNLFDTTVNKQMGGSALRKIVSNKFSPIPKTNHYDENSKELKYLKKFTDYCAKKNIKLILCYLPFAANTSHQMTANTIELFAKSNNIPYINFLDKNIVNYNTDMFDKGHPAGQHLNSSGARKVTDYIGKYLKENYNLEDHRTNNKYAKKWNTWYADYKELLKENIKKQTDLKIILMLLNNSNFTGKLTYSDRYQFDKTEKTLLAQIAKTCSTKKVSYKKNGNFDVVVEIFDSKTKEKVHRMVYRKNNKGLLKVVEK